MEGWLATDFLTNDYDHLLRHSFLLKDCECQLRHSYHQTSLIDEKPTGDVQEFKLD